MIALAYALLRSFAADRAALVLAFLAPIAFFSLFAIFFRHLEAPEGVRFPVALVVRSESPGAERLAAALVARSEGRISVERVDASRALDDSRRFVALIEIPADFDGAAPSVRVESRWPLPGVADALRQMVAAAGATALLDRASVQPPPAPLPKVDDSSMTGSLTRAAAPGIAVMFVLFALSAQAARGVGDEEAGLGERLRSLGLSANGRMLARFLTLSAIACAQLAATFVFAALAFGVVPAQPWALLVAIALSASCAAAFTSALSETCVTRARFAAISPVATLLLAGLGGSMVPVAVLPDSLAAPSRWLFTGWSIEACVHASEGRGAFLEWGLLAAGTFAFLLIAATFAPRNEVR